MSNSVNVKVIVRCRPLSQREKDRNSVNIISIQDGKTVQMKNPHGGDTPKQYTFDHSYGIDSTQKEIYEQIGKPIVDSAMEGYNGTIYAYGQTGSGKTWTMMGYSGDLGVVPLMNLNIFSRIKDIQSTGTKVLMTVSFLEIYNEVIKDLLNPSEKTLKIRQHPEMGIYVESLAELIVREPEDVDHLIEQGNKVRQVAATQMNERSSRSHSCFTIKISLKSMEEVGDVQRETCTSAKINLVDLAGSERAAKTGATGDRLKEGAAINASLSALGNVITMLASNKPGAHIPYRDSKLTRLLQESLGGNSLTVMVAAISPADYNFDETLGTLRYADRAKSIKNATKKNEDVNEKMIRELREEIQRLKDMVQSGGTGRPTMMALDDDAANDNKTKMEEMIANLERAKQQSWEEKERLAELYEEERQKSLANEANVLHFMQTVKEEKVEAMKRVRNLQQHKAKLAKKFNEKKDHYMENKTKLQKDMKAYQQILANVPDNSTPEKDELRERELEVLLHGIEQIREKLVEDRDLLGKIKEKQQAIDDKLVEERAEMVSKSAVLQEDEKLRKAIQDDERQKMEVLKEEFLASELEKERERIRQEAIDDKQRLEERYAGSADWFEKEKLLQNQIATHEQKITKLQHKIINMRSTHAQSQRETKKQLQTYLDDLSTTFDSEKSVMDKKYHQAIQIITQAKMDIEYLTKRNIQLERDLALASAWEPTIY